MSLTKSANGYGGYGYGHSKPQMNYHQQNAEYVTTVVKEITRMTVNEKPGFYGGAGAGQKQAYKEEVYEEGYGAGGYGGGAVQKQAYKEKAYEEHDQAYTGGYGGGAMEKHSYKEEAYECADGGGYALQPVNAAVKEHDYRKDKYGEAGAGYGGSVQQHAYQKAYGEADAGYAGAHYGAVQTNAYKQQAAYGGAEHAYQKDPLYCGADAGAGAGYGGGAYYGGGGAVKNGRYHQDAYRGTNAAAGYGGGAGKKNGYRKDEYSAHYGGGAMQTKVAGQKHGAGYKHSAYGYNHKGYGSGSESESDCDDSDDESDCEEAFPPRGPKHGGAHNSYAYKRAEKHGGSNLGGVRRYESYQSTTQQGYGAAAAAGGGYGACPPGKNRFF